MIKKSVKRFSFILILLCHLVFLGTILFEKQDNFLVLIFVLIVLVLLSITYKKTTLSTSNHAFEHVLTVAFVFFGAIITYIFREQLNINSILASSLVGMMASYVPSFFKKTPLVMSIPASVYCGTFVGMTSSDIATDYIFITVASAITGFLLVSTKEMFQGVGGKLGSLAFVGVMLTFFITFLLTEWF